MSHATETAANVLSWISIAILAGFLMELSFQVGAQTPPSSLLPPCAAHTIRPPPPRIPPQLVLFGWPWLRHWGHSIDLTVVAISFALGERRTVPATPPILCVPTGSECVKCPTRLLHRPTPAAAQKSP